MKPILFVFGSATSYRLQKLLVEFCVLHKRAVSLVYDGAPDKLFDVAQDDARRIGATAWSLDAEIAPSTRPPQDQVAAVASLRALVFRVILAARRADEATAASPRLRHQLAQRFLYKGFFASQDNRARAFYSLIADRVAAAQRLMSKIDPSVVIVSEDGVSGSLAVEAAARGRNVKVLDLPYGYGTQDDFDVALERKARDGELIYPKGYAKALLRMLAPQWIKRGKFEGTLLFPPEYIMACEAFGLTVRDAWIVHGGHADELLAESQQMRKLYLEQGIPADKVVLTGTPYCDEMLAGLRDHPEALAALRKPRRIERGKTRILVSWPPSYHAERAEHCEFRTYQDMTRALLGWLASLPECSLTVSLHPAAPAEDRKSLADIGLKVEEEYVLRLIPRHDIYVSYFSSTIRWAIAAGKPVVNYDAYKLGLDVYGGAPAFINAADFPTFQKAILALIASEESYAAAADRQILAAPNWGQLDGRCRERVLTEIDKVARR